MEQTGKRNFDEAAKNWDENPGRVAIARTVAAAILERVPVSGETEALEIGCGTGLVTLELQPHLKSITAVDGSVGMLDALEKKLEAAGIENVRPVQIDLETASVPRGFDFIYSSMTLHHIEDTSALLKDLRQALNPGGWIAMADLDEEGGLFHADNTGVRHFGFSREEIARQFEDAGLRDVAVTTAFVVQRDEREFPIFLAVGHI